MSASDSADRGQYLSFTLAGSDYAVGILQVKEILQYEAVTPVPSVPRSIRGVINLRGAVVPVVDLAVKFGLAPTPVTKRTCIVIVEAALEGERTVLGVVADAVREVLELGPGDVEPPPAFGTQVRVDYLKGMGKSGKGFVLLLELDRVVSAADLDVGMPVMGGAGAATPSTPAAAEPPRAEADVSVAAPSGPGASALAEGQGAGELPKEIADAIRAHLQWKVRIRSAIACGKLPMPIQTVRADDACAFGRWLHGGNLPVAVKENERLGAVKRLHRSFHQATANVAELAMAGRKKEAEAALAEAGTFTAASNALLEVLRAWR